jgi:hypothetical protein
LDFIRAQRVQAIKTGAETGQVFARQADDQIGMDVRMTVLVKSAQIVFGAVIVLLAADQRLYLRRKGLHADFKLQRAGRELLQQFFQAIGQPVGNNFEVQKQIVAQTIEEKL